MTTEPLPRHAEDLRREIKSMIPEACAIKEDQLQFATVSSEDSEGNKEYVGELLGKKVSALVQQLPIGAGWGWTLVYFRKSRGVMNVLKDMYLIPLSGGATITPGGSLEEGTYTHIKDEPVLSSDTAVIFIARP
ncbi:uncharacterized protein N7511_001736 [Penicillium nucicola]|uniref:uncharacterized protein n=1 Tax=Penicillium nucicola TaxID=1850975 RepID=UPI002544F9A2|nr:uncharacterized protein N7511_001736 [Penicillium nucicola]KAJ5776725.1 hypothetical protein N7511_001736 [Penicillium nucicola]